MSNAVKKKAIADLNRMVTFRDAISPRPNGMMASIFMGESGIPQARPGSSQAQHQTDVASWQDVFEGWYKVCDDNDMWVTAWASGFWGDYELGIHTNAVGYTATGTNLNREMAPGGIDVVEAHPAMNANVKRGVNVAGMDFGVDATFSNANPGTNGGSYFVPTAGDATYLSGRGVKLVRLPFLWERMQPTPLGPLDTTHLGYLNSFIDACATYGISVIPDMHNYGRYHYDIGGGQKRVLRLSLEPGINTTPDASQNNEGTIGIECLRDVWKKLSDQWKNKTNVVGYDWQNEPGALGSGEKVAWYGVIGTQGSATDRQQAKDNGLTHVFLQAYWANLQPTAAGQALDATELNNLIGAINDAKAKGLKVLFECSLQYPPTWVTTSVPRFRNQNNGTWNGVSANGDDVYDWVWTQTGRNYVQDFIKKVFAAIDPTKIDAIKIGGLASGELHYPSEGASSPYNFWGYGAAAQSGTDLAVGQAQCPVAVRSPFVPFAAGNSAANNDAWINWYLGSINNWMMWQINQYKLAGVGGLIYVQHPSFGIRQSWVTTHDFTNTGWQQGVAQGADWAGQMDLYKMDRQCWPYCTWMDATDPWTPPSVDTDKASWRYLLELAQARNKHYLIWGENTGGQSDADMNRVFSQAIALGYIGIVWLNKTTLNAGGGAASYATFASNISATASGAFSGTTRYDWEASTPNATQGWTNETANVTLSRDTATVDSGTGSLKITHTIPAGVTGNYYLRFNDGGTNAGSGSGNAIRVRAFIPNGTPGGNAWKLGPEWQNASFQWQNVGFRNLTMGSWVNVDESWAGGISGARAWGCEWRIDDVAAIAGQTITLYIDNFQQGSLSSIKSITPQLFWEIITQELTSKIRSNSDSHISVCEGQSWSVNGFPHTQPWIVEPTNPDGSLVGNHMYSTHHYFDHDDSGNYDATNETFALTLTACQADGYTNDADTTPPTISNAAVSSLGTTSVSVRFDTNEAADSRGIAHTASQATWFTTTNRVDTGLVTTGHSITFTNLVPSTTYTVELRAQDAALNLGKAAFSFTTATSGSFTRTIPLSVAISIAPVTRTRTIPITVAISRTGTIAPRIIPLSVAVSTAAAPVVPPDTRPDVVVAVRATPGPTVRGKFLSASIPKILRMATVWQAFFQVVGTQFDQSWSTIDDIRKQFYMGSATWTLPQWEDEFGLPIGITRTDQQRQERLLSRSRGLSIATRQNLMAIANSFVGGGIEIVEDFTANSLVITFNSLLGVPSNITDLQDAVEAIKPKHLSIAWTFQWETWDRWDAHNFSWDQSDALNLTWDRVDVYQ